MNALLPVLYLFARYLNKILYHLHATVVDRIKELVNDQLGKPLLLSTKTALTKSYEH